LKNSSNSSVYRHLPILGLEHLETILISSFSISKSRQPLTIHIYFLYENITNELHLYPIPELHLMRLTPLEYSWLRCEYRE